MKRARVEATCDYVGIELPGRVVLKHGEHYFTVPQDVVQFIWDDQELKIRYNKAEQLIRDALDMRAHGEHPPDETWKHFEQDAETFLRNRP
jgi:hypothetical protein